jgi:hypothetical protein
VLLIIGGDHFRSGVVKVEARSAPHVPLTSRIIHITQQHSPQQHQQSLGNMQAGRKKPDKLKNMLADAEQQHQKKVLEMERLLRTNVSVPQTTAAAATPSGECG